MFEEAIGHQTGHVLPVAVSLIGKFFLQSLFIDKCALPGRVLSLVYSI
jgi:hypothetical protein